MNPFLTARNHLGVELGAGATAAHVRTVAARGFEVAVLDAAAVARIASVVSGIGLVVRGGADDVLDRFPGRVGWEPARGTAAIAGPSDVPLFVHLDARDPSFAVAVRRADAVRLAAPDLAAAAAARERIRAAVAATGRDPDDVPVFVDLDVHVDEKRRTGSLALDIIGSVNDIARVIEAAVRMRAADGVVLRPRDPDADLPPIAAGLVPLLAGRGLFRPGPAGSMRTRLALGPRTTSVPTRTVESA